MNAFFVIFCCVVAASSVKANDVAVPDEGPFRGDRNIEFDWKLTQNIFSKQRSNTVISPFSVKILLTLLYEASNDAANLSETQTKKELRLVLEPNGNLNDTRSKFRMFLDSALKTNPLYDLQIGTKFFVDEFIDVITKYQSISYEYYNATVDKVPFSKPAVAAKQINDWVSKTTNGRINELVNAEGVEGAVITLINALYFKGLWKYPFPENGPKRTFNAAGRSVQADYMEQNAQLYYDDSANLGAQLLRMPYQGGKFSMYFMLPHQGQSVDDVLSRITPQALHQALWYMDESDVNVTIPKFRFDFSEELNQPLQDIGIKEIFSVNASLPLLSRGKGNRSQVRVSKVFQKAGITVNEVGSEAYAATEIQLVNKFGGDGTQIFNANRPFVFFIEDETTGSLLVVGKVEDPTK